MLGAGRVGTTLAVLWRRGGHEIVAVSGRGSTAARAAEYLPGAPVVGPVEAVAGADVVVVGVPDAVIATVAEEVRSALPSGTWLAHLSGAAPLGVLGAWPRRFALHLLQTFPDIGVERVAGCAAAVTADDEEGRGLGEALARDAGAIPFILRDEDRALYHAAAVFASNHVVANAVIAEHLFSLSGVRDPLAAMAPLQRATVENIAALGPGSALTGPAVRGDAVTISANLGALRIAAPEAVPVYVAMCRSMADLALRAGRLDAAGRSAVEEALVPWS